MGASEAIITLPLKDAETFSDAIEDIWRSSDDPEVVRICKSVILQISWWTCEHKPKGEERVDKR